MKENSNRISSHEKILSIIESSYDMPAQEAIDVLSKCIKTEYNLASEKAIQVLAKINHPSITSALITLYDWFETDPRKRDRSCEARATIAGALGDIGSTLSIDTLRKAVRTIQIAKLGPSIEDVAIGLRATAALALAKVDHESLFELAVLLFDEKPDVPVGLRDRPQVKASVRKAAAQAIGILGDLGGMAILALKLKFPNNEIPDVIAECIESLICMRPPYLMEIVEPYLKEYNDNLSAITALSLAENLGIEVIDSLYEALDHVKGETKETIVVAISIATRGNGTRQIMFDFLEHPNSFVRRGAIKEIKKYLNDEIREKLKILCDDDPDEAVRLEANLGLNS
jgi:HEAT repeat protein